MPSFSLTERQKEYVREAHHRWNFAEGAVRSGKSWPANNFTIPDRILHGVGLDGIDLLMGVSLGNIERNVLAPMREQFGEGRAYAPIMRLFGRAAIPTTYEGVKSIIDRKMKAGEISQPREIFENMSGEKTHGARGRKAD